MKHLSRSATYALRCALIALMLFAGGVTTTAHAVDNQKAQDWYKLAMDAYKAQRFRDAAMAFDAAYRSDPAAELLYNAGRAYEKAGVLDRAIERYRSFLVEKDTSKDLRQKAMDSLVNLQVQKSAAQQQQQAASTDLAERNTANSALQLQLAEAERRRLELELQLEAERRAANAGSPAAVVDEAPEATTAFVQVAFGDDDPLGDLVVRDGTGARHTCPADSGSCAFDVAPGRSTFRMKNLDDGERLATLHAGRSYIYEAEVIEIKKMSMSQLSGAIIGGLGTVILLLGVPLSLPAYGLGAMSDEEFFAMVGVGSGLMLAGGGMYFFAPPEYRTSLRLNESRMQSDAGGLMGPVSVSAVPVDGGVVLGATGQF